MKTVTIKLRNADIFTEKQLYGQFDTYQPDEVAGAVFGQIVKKHSLTSSVVRQNLYLYTRGLDDRGRLRR